MFMFTSSLPTPTLSVPSCLSYPVSDSVVAIPPLAVSPNWVPPVRIAREVEPVSVSDMPVADERTED